jgi:hypothetical protein
VGDRLGLYTAVRALPNASPGELAAEAGISKRYAREWLEQQAVAGLIDVVGQEADPAVRRSGCPPQWPR